MGIKDRPRRTPQQKKEDEYDRDHHHPNAHGFWRDWRKEKARVQRKVRRKTVRLERESVTTAHDLELFEAAERRTVYQAQKLSKESPPSVRERVRTQREARLWKTGWDRFFKRPYDSATHREPFRRFLGALMQGRSGESVKLAGYFRSVLAVTCSGSGAHGIEGTTARWLHAFFAEERELAVRFKGWIRRTATGNDETKTT